MPNITPEFCSSEAARLTRLAISAIDRDSRNELLAIAAHYREIAAQLRTERARLAGADPIDGNENL